MTRFERNKLHCTKGPVLLRASTTKLLKWSKTMDQDQDIIHQHVATFF